MSLPNVVIVGAPKCGTSSVFAWLADHTEVGSSHVKETFYLMDKGNPLLKPHSNFHEHGLEGYKAYFEDYDSNFYRASIRFRTLLLFFVSHQSVYFLILDTHSITLLTSTRTYLFLSLFMPSLAVQPNY